MLNISLKRFWRQKGWNCVFDFWYGSFLLSEDLRRTDPSAGAVVWLRSWTTLAGKMSAWPLLRRSKPQGYWLCIEEFLASPQDKEITVGLGLQFAQPGPSPGYTLLRNRLTGSCNSLGGKENRFVPLHRDLMFVTWKKPGMHIDVFVYDHLSYAQWLREYCWNFVVVHSNCRFYWGSSVRWIRISSSPKHKMRFARLGCVNGDLVIKTAHQNIS